ncbi:hypothetical protein HPB52_006449 [Rhipicephalus sanguineus]|uniref:Uncharacterized protein n=1 Tax=Rhipicephalus sanguineus TaxID=34632 RepID=A0A9D4T1B4_RHISA|nr:hypothetical protein HPB52_006449 [Rhipicephalus sanguineus]
MEAPMMMESDLRAAVWQDHGWTPGSDAAGTLVHLSTKVNEVAGAKKLLLFLSAIGEEAYVTLWSLLLPMTPSTSSYQEVV